MKRIPIHRGGITSAGYDRTRRWLDVEFDTKRVLRAEMWGQKLRTVFFIPARRTNTGKKKSKMSTPCVKFPPRKATRRSPQPRNLLTT